MCYLRYRVSIQSVKLQALTYVTILSHWGLDSHHIAGGSLHCLWEAYTALRGLQCTWEPYTALRGLHYLLEAYTACERLTLPVRGLHCLSVAYTACEWLIIVISYLNLLLLDHKFSSGRQNGHRAKIAVSQQNLLSFCPTVELWEDSCDLRGLKSLTEWDLCDWRRVKSLTEWDLCDCRRVKSLTEWDLCDCRRVKSLTECYTFQAAVNVILT